MEQNTIIFDIEEVPEGYLEEIMSGRRTLYDIYKKPMLTGKMAYHSYTTYEEEDSQIFILDFETGDQYCINDKFDKSIRHTMNPCFNKYGTHIVFMGLAPRSYGDEWDVFIYELSTGRCVNLTKDNGYSNQDPRFSQDAMHVIYKQGKWKEELDAMFYDIWEMNFEEYRTYALTNNEHMQSMPCYGKDKSIVYCSMKKEEEPHGPLMKLTIKNQEEKSEIAYNQENIYSYFPVYHNDKLYFARWHSIDNHMDKVLIMDAETNEIVDPLFNDPNYNVSDPCPITDRYMIVSSTKDYKDKYSLYLADVDTGILFNLDKEYGFETNDMRNQLEASCVITSITEIS